MGVGVMGHNPSGRSVGGLRRWLDECGLHRISVGTIAVALAVLAVTVAAIVSVLVPIPVLAPLAGVAGLAIPIATLDAARTRRRVLAESRWPDVIDAIRMAIRSGVPLHEALESVVAQVPTDWRVAWNDATSSLARGASVANALMRLRATLAEPIADRVCESIIIATEMGGTELPRVLEELARSTREEIRIRREATSRQSWVRHAARLGAAAPWLVVVLLGSRPENRTAFTSAAGVSLLVACAGATVVAYIVMTAMGRLPEARRWVRDD
ncbi:MAG: hypothetical protein RLZ72_608 [Actinomycetota bacterium]